MAFREGASLGVGQQYALDKVNLFVTVGDGANWIRSGVEEFSEETKTAIGDVGEAREPPVPLGYNAPADARSLGMMESSETSSSPAG